MMRSSIFFGQHFVAIMSVVIMVLPGCQRKPSAMPDSTGSTVIAAIGDSLTWGALAFGPKAASGGYPTILETLLRDEGHDVVVFNKGIPGEKAYQTRARFERAIADADIALLMIGVNDIIRPQACPEPHNCRTNEHIEAMIKYASKAGVPLIVSTLTPAQNNCARSWANESIQAVNARLRTYTQEHILPLVDNHQSIVEHGDGMLFSDCLHFTDAGYQVIAEHWFQALIAYQFVEKSTP